MNAEIEDIIQKFTQSAVLAREINVDGIHLHGYVLSHFLSPAFRQRTDKWGKSTENRLRIMQEIVNEIHKIVPICSRYG
jgi:2,4-dienoyl-CoA reductase-like NADH-dependent reductase (Old Yellow Enzyme family)